MCLPINSTNDNRWKANWYHLALFAAASARVLKNPEPCRRRMWASSENLFCVKWFRFERTVRENPRILTACYGWFLSKRNPPLQDLSKVNYGDSSIITSKCFCFETSLPNSSISRQNKTCYADTLVVCIGCFKCEPKPSVVCSTRCRMW